MKILRILGSLLETANNEISRTRKTVYTKTPEKHKQNKSKHCVIVMAKLDFGQSEKMHFPPFISEMEIYCQKNNICLVLLNFLKMCIL